MSITAKEITIALHGRWRSTHGNGYAICPAHAPPAKRQKNPYSLIVREAPGGGLWLGCIEGCEQHQIIERLRERGLWQLPPKKAEPSLGEVAMKTWHPRERL